MPSRALLIEVRLLDGRYHGVGDWPPAPFRLFQALVAGAYGGRWRKESTDEKDAAFRWLEGLDPPLIAAPSKLDARATSYFVPNNDLDAVGGDPQRVSEIRVGKVVRPVLFNADDPIVYAWPFDEGDLLAEQLCQLATRLHTLGWGIDSAFAHAEISEWEDAVACLRRRGGVVASPAGLGNPARDPYAPTLGSIDSLKARHNASAKRFEERKEQRNVVTLFHQPPKAFFRTIRYDRPPTRFLFDLISGNGAANFRPVPQNRAMWLVEQVRDRLASVLCRSFNPAMVERIVVGRGAAEADKARRIRIIPLPSIGFTHADRAIRRVVIEVPSDCSIPAEKIALAAGSVHLGADEQGEIAEGKEHLPQLVRAADEEMLDYYGVRAGRTFRVWRTVTPAALPERTARGRIDPARVRLREEQKTGSERAQEEARAAGAVLQALRHAGIDVSAETIRVQREPFERRGARAEAFAEGTRFAKERLWHVEIAFAENVSGPIVIGDGRYLGLGLMVPVTDAWREVLVFAVPRESDIAAADGPALAHAARRALMALSRDGKGDVPRLFSGHQADGGPAASGRQEHIFLAADDADGDGRIDRLVVAAPWACDRNTHGRGADRARFDRVVSEVERIRAGRLGVIVLGRPETPVENDPLIGPARVWESRTLYRPTRHAGRRKDLTEALTRDLVAECQRRGLPQPDVDILDLSAGPKGGAISARARVKFAVAVRGPLLLGRDSHKGGGLFACAQT